MSRPAAPKAHGTAAAGGGYPVTFDAAAQDRVYAHCSNAIAAAGRDKESLLLARLALLLFEQLGDEQRCKAAIDAALLELPTPSLSAD